VLDAYLVLVLISPPVTHSQLSAKHSPIRANAKHPQLLNRPKRSTRPHLSAPAQTRHLTSPLTYRHSQAAPDSTCCNRPHRPAPAPPPDPCPARRDRALESGLASPAPAWVRGGIEAGNQIMEIAKPHVERASQEFHTTVRDPDRPDSQPARTWKQIFRFHARWSRRCSKLLRYGW
jgi:hypothetical protein